MSKTVVYSTLLTAILSASSFSSEARVCYVTPPVQDGCTLPSGLKEVAKPFTSLWKNQCNAHDRNYQILGKSKQSSDSEFYADMRNRCDSKFNKVLLFSANQACRTAAYAVYVGLKNVDSEEYYKPNQRKRAAQTSSLYNKLNSDSCGITPEYAGFYDPALLSYLKSTFKRIAGRAPTAYERFELLELYSPDIPMSTWKRDVETRSYQLQRVSGPEVKKLNKNTLNEFRQDASASLRAQRYEWRLNIGSSDSSIFSKYYLTKYNETYNIRGTLKVVDRNGKRDLMVIDESFTSKGACAPDDSLYCF